MNVLKSALVTPLVQPESSMVLNLQLKRSSCSSQRYAVPSRPNLQTGAWQMLDLEGNCAELTTKANKSDVKYCEDTRPGHQLETSKQHETF